MVCSSGGAAQQGWPFLCHWNMILHLLNSLHFMKACPYFILCLDMHSLILCTLVTLCPFLLRVKLALLFSGPSLGTNLWGGVVAHLVQFVMEFAVCAILRLKHNGFYAPGSSLTAFWQKCFHIFAWDKMASAVQVNSHLSHISVPLKQYLAVFNPFIHSPMFCISPIIHMYPIYTHPSYPSLYSNPHSSFHMFSFNLYLTHLKQWGVDPHFQWRWDFIRQKENKNNNRQ